jgi:Mn-containing catalase
MWRFAQPDDYEEISKIWTGSKPTGDGQFQVQDGPPPGGPVPPLPEGVESFAPAANMAELQEMARKLFG